MTEITLHTINVIHWQGHYKEIHTVLHSRLETVSWHRGFIFIYFLTLPNKSVKFSLSICLCIMSVFCFCVFAGLVSERCLFLSNLAPFLTSLNQAFNEATTTVQKTFSVRYHFSLQLKVLELRKSWEMLNVCFFFRGSHYLVDKGAEEAKTRRKKIWFSLNSKWAVTNRGRKVKVGVMWGPWSWEDNYFRGFGT